MSETFTHFVFVDFENVPKVDLAPIEGKAAHVTLLIGKNQTKIDTALSLQLNKFADKVDPVLVEGSGRNALDMILACYLGRAVEKHPGAQFYIVNKDKDFVPLINHLRAQGIQVSRHETFAALPFLAPARKAATKPPFPVSAPPSAAPKASPASKQVAVDRLGKITESLKNAANRNRPGTRSALQHHLKNALGKNATDTQVQSLMDRLRAQKSPHNFKGRYCRLPATLNSATSTLIFRSGPPAFANVASIRYAPSVRSV